MANNARYVAARGRVNDWLRQQGLEHGRMLNLKKSMVVHDYVGEFTLNDVWMYIMVLWNTRPQTVDRLVQAIDQERFDAIFVSPGVTTAANDTGDAPWARIVHAVFAHYELGLHEEEVNVLVRRDRTKLSGLGGPLRPGLRVSIASCSTQATQNEFRLRTLAT